MDDRSVRAHIYEVLVATGRPPTAKSTAEELSISEAEASAAFRRLAEDHEIALLPGTDQVWMAHPFSAVPTDYLVEARDGRRWWANCAWDAVAIPGLVGDCTVHATLADGEAFQVTVSDGAVSPEHLIHFQVPARNFWDDIGST